MKIRAKTWGSRISLLTLVGVLFVGCWFHGSGETGVAFFPDRAAIAVGAFYDVAVVDTCSNASTDISGSGQGKVPTSLVVDVGIQTCEFSHVEGIQDASSSDASLLAVHQVQALDMYGIVTLEALAQGGAQIDARIEASTGTYKLSGNYTAVEADEAVLIPLCGYKQIPSPDKDPVNVVGGWNQPFAFELHRNSIGRLGGYGFYPFDFGGLDIVEGDADQFSIATPDDFRVIQVSSSVDPDFHLTVNVVAAAAIDNLNLSHGLDTCASEVSVRPAAGEVDSFCNGWLFTELTIETPEACYFRYLPDELSVDLADGRTDDRQYEPRVEVDSRGSGPCRLRGKIKGAEYAETIEIPFAGCHVWDQRFEEEVVTMVEVAGGGRLVFTPQAGVFLDDGTDISLVQEFTYGVQTAWGESADHFIVVSGDRFYTCDEGVCMEQIFEGEHYLDSIALAPDDVLLVGSRGDVGRYRNGTLETLPGGDNVTLNAVWAASESDAFAVGVYSEDEKCRIMHFDGERWSEVFKCEWNWSLNDVWGSGPEDVFAVGERGMVLHYDGEAWTPMETGFEGDMLAVSGTGPDRVVVTGRDGLVLTYDGASWSPEWVRSAGQLTLAHFTPEGSLLVAGPDGIFAQPGT